MLNGTSSSGKSTLAKALQARLDGPWLGVGIDTVVFALPKAYLDQPLLGRGLPVRAGRAGVGGARSGSRPASSGDRLVQGLHGMVAALADARA